MTNSELEPAEPRIPKLNSVLWRALPLVIAALCLVMAVLKLLGGDYWGCLAYLPLALVYLTLRHLYRSWTNTSYAIARAELLDALAEAEKRGLTGTELWATEYRRTIVNWNASL